MRRKKRQEMGVDDSNGLRPSERHNFCLIGLIPDQIQELGRLFAQEDREKLSMYLREEAGIPWSKSFEDTWDEAGDEVARARGLFDLIWHRRALAIDPVVNAPDFTGFDVLLSIAQQAVPEVAELLVKVDGNNSSNPRRSEGPEWWGIWHQANGSKPAGWLSAEEAAHIHKLWSDLATPEVEEACLTIMGIPYTHPGCWSLMEEFGGFFAQCLSERRSVVGEVDL